MKKNILDKIKNTITEYEMIQPGDGIVVGLSGGPDSVCLFHSLCSLRDELGISGIYAVHINHCLRGEESDGDEAYARELASTNGADFYAFRYDVNAIAAKSGQGTEEAGRRLRYAAFEKVRKEKGAARIAVAHNMNDQAETLLMRIMRGTGLRGLSGIDQVREDGIVIRPVLDLSRAEIEEYCRENQLQPHIDSTNAESIYTRNKIRLQLLPQMQRDYNPAVIDALVRLSRQAREDEDFILTAARSFADGEAGENIPDSSEEYENSKSYINDAIEKESREKPGGSINRRWNDREKSLKLEGFAALHPSVAKRVIMLCAARAGMEQNTSMTGVEKVLELASSLAEAKETDLSDGFYARISYGKLWILRRGRKKKDSRAEIAEKESAGQKTGLKSISIPLDQLLEKTDGSIELMYDDKVIKLRILDKNEAAKALSMVKKQEKGNIKPVDGRPVRLLLDLDRLASKDELVFRYRQPGDRISPIGMKGSKKLQDYFTDRKIPKHMRDKILLLVSGGRVIMAGSEVSSECPVNKGTDRILSIEY